MIPAVLLHALGSSARAWASFSAELPGAPGLVRRMVIEDAPPPPHEPAPLLEPPADVTAGTLWLAGGPADHVDQDRIHQAAARMPSARVVEVPAGHRVHSEAPDRFAAVVVPFLAE
jgi:pimeloyl-ACP methyl ester carboxylesterase